jgi:hypothetical protein
MILRTRIGGRVLWLIEEPARARGRRRVLLAVDTSDSCWPAHRASIEAALRSVANGLQAGDECRLWIMGHAEPVVETSLAGDTEGARVTLCRSLLSAVCDQRGGTWLRETAGAMIAAAVSGSESIDYLLVITDGETIFDAEAVPPPPAVVAAAVHCMDGCGLGGRRDRASGVPAWLRAPEDLSAWLALDRGNVRLDAGVGGATAYRFGEDGQVDPGPVAWPQSVQGRYARYAVLADDLPPLRLITSRGARVWRDALAGDQRDMVAIEALSPSLRHVARRVWGLQLDWRNDVLTLLRDAEDADIRCPNCGAGHVASDVRTGRGAYCGTCRALLLVNGFARRDDPSLAHAAAVLVTPTGAPLLLAEATGARTQGAAVILLDQGRF